MENALRLFEASKTPETQSIAMHAAQNRAVVNIAPRQHAIKVVFQGELADAQTDLIMSKGILWKVMPSRQFGSIESRRRDTDGRHNATVFLA